jgi:hypothetical protein
MQNKKLTDLVFELLGEEGDCDAGLSYHLTHNHKDQISEPTNTKFFHTKRGREVGVFKVKDPKV